MKVEKRVLTLRSGERVKVTGESGRYYLCEGNTQYRKSSPQVLKVEVITTPKKAAKEDDE